MIPTLYSFRRCPYAIRARLVLNFCKINYHLVEINLKNKSKEFVDLSPKATVPVLKIHENKIIEESLDIMLWASKKYTNKPLCYNLSEQINLIQTTENKFKPFLDKFKYGDKNKKIKKLYYRFLSEFFLKNLQKKLIKHKFLISNDISIVDFAIFPFVRQFYNSDKSYFGNPKFKYLTKWLEYFINSVMFKTVMKKKLI